MHVVTGMHKTHNWAQVIQELFLKEIYIINLIQFLLNISYCRPYK